MFVWSGACVRALYVVRAPQAVSPGPHTLLEEGGWVIAHQARASQSFGAKSFPPKLLHRQWGQRARVHAETHVLA